MNRWIITAIAGGAIAILTAAPGCGATGVGDPCTPDEEYDPTFQGFSVNDVSVESKSYVCLSRLCLVNHFQGRVTCPYGQSAANKGPAGPPGSVAASINSQFGCAIPGAVADPTTGYPAQSQVKATNGSVGSVACLAGEVPAQLVGANAADRTANKAVYCSCRCANVDGDTNDGANYCTCPENYTCTQLVSSIGSSDSGLTGAYCVQNGTQYNAALTPSTTCPAGGGECDPTVTTAGAAGNCPLQY
jgi:hypothetical protein